MLAWEVLEEEAADGVFFGQILLHFGVESDEGPFTLDVGTMGASMDTKLESMKETCRDFVMHLAEVQLSADSFQAFKSWHRNLGEIQFFDHKKINKAWFNLEQVVGGQKKGTGLTWSSEELEAVIDGYNQHGPNWMRIAEFDVFRDIRERVSNNEGGTNKEGLNKLICEKVKYLLNKQKRFEDEYESKKRRKNFE